MARDLGSFGLILTIDFEELCAYKRGDYQQCLQLSTQNVHTLLYASDKPHAADLPLVPEFIQLLDDDIASLAALTSIFHLFYRSTANPYRLQRKSFYDICISQETLSLYLMTQCQLKLHHSLSSLAQTLHYIRLKKLRIGKNRK